MCVVRSAEAELGVRFPLVRTAEGSTDRFRVALGLLSLLAIAVVAETGVNMHRESIY